MTVLDMRLSLGCTQSEFASRYSIPLRTIQNWETGARNPPEYVLQLMEAQVKADLFNRRTTSLPTYDARKADLPRRQDYLGSTSWLKAVQECIGDDVVFALDEALMCHGAFGGRSDEFLIWVYGDASISRFNGVVVLGTEIKDQDVCSSNGIRYTTFNRTVLDALTNESILDMQGITEALSKYYYRNHESFDGIILPPSYQNRFIQLGQEAIDYYDD